MAATKAVAADEDDFHVFKRKQMKVERAIKASEKAAFRVKQQAVSSRPTDSKVKPKVVAF
jgi:zinc finger CCHC domain-containing protein 9